MVINLPVSHPANQCHKTLKEQILKSISKDIKKNTLLRKLDKGANSEGKKLKKGKDCKNECVCKVGHKFNIQKKLGY